MHKRPLCLYGGKPKELQSGDSLIPRGTTPPSNPQVGDLWLDESQGFPDSSSYIDLTSKSTDYHLQRGQTGYVSYSNATSVPLHIAVKEGVYNLRLINASLGISDYSNVNNIFLLPNNAAVTAGAINWSRIMQGDNSTNPSYDATSQTGFIVSNDKTGIVSSIDIYTYLTRKMVHGAMYIKTATDQMSQYIFHQPWMDTTTVWSSLGTLSMTAAQSGIVIVKRLF